MSIWSATNNIVYFLGFTPQSIVLDCFDMKGSGKGIISGQLVENLFQVTPATGNMNTCITAVASITNFILSAR